ncbi:MAG: rpoN, partial [Caulobacteraceae bacterium]|nr:rpoN [Caulobacteraceae bacterium]
MQELGQERAELALAARLELRQGQGLVITPQLQQAIKLLQLSNIELDAYVEGELERNPLLVRDEDEPAPESGPEVETPSQAEAAADHAVSADLDATPEDSTPGQMASDEASAGGAIDWSRTGGGGSFEGDGEDMESRLTRELTLAEHLEAQLTVAALDGPERAIALQLIGAVDEAGYLRADLDELAQRLGCETSRVEAVLTVIQGFEPTGVAARDVRECLSLQLAEKDRLDPAMQALLANLDLVAKRDMAQLRKLCAVDDEDLRDMLAELRALTPKPGAAFGGEPASGVVPDVHVREGLGGLWHVELNADTLPRVLVDQRYHARIAGGARKEADKVFVADCLSSANWLVKSLDQRAKTILKVASEIVRQ